METSPLFYSKSKNNRLSFGTNGSGRLSPDPPPVEKISGRHFQVSIKKGSNQKCCCQKKQAEKPAFPIIGSSCKETLRNGQSEEGRNAAVGEKEWHMNHVYRKGPVPQSLRRRPGQETAHRRVIVCCGNDQQGKERHCDKFVHIEMEGK